MSENNINAGTSSKNGFVHSGSSPTLKMALQYAKHGWPVIPLHTPDAQGHCDCQKANCNSIGKHPRTMHGIKDATTDESTIRRWWRMWPEANIGIATGRKSGFVVLDVDKQHNGNRSLAYLEDDYGKLPTTLTTTTGGGGSHIFFSQPQQELRGSSSKIARGLDFRAEGNYVVAPPSLHPSGKRYAWNGKETIATMPKWLATLAEQQPAESTTIDDEIPEGRRNQELTSLGGSMRRRGCELPEIESLLSEVNNRRCKPPLSADEVKQIATSVSKYRADVQINHGRGLSLGFDRSPKQVMFESALELLSRKFSEPKWAVDGLLSEGATVFAGSPKVGKSLFALGLAVAISSGGRALGSIAVAKGDVLYLALEDGPKRIQKRIRILLQGGHTPERLSFAYDFPRVNEGGFEQIEDWLKKHDQARLVVIDTLKRFRPIEKRAGRIYDLDYDAVSPLNDLGQKYGVSILLIHHTRKIRESDDWLDDISGSLGLSAGVDNAALLRRPRKNSKGVLYIAGRDIEDKELEVEIDHQIENWKLVGDALGKLAEKILQWLLDAGEKGLSRSDVNKKNGGRTEGVFEALEELKTRGLAGSVPIPTKGKSQERWFASSYLPVNDDNDDSDEINSKHASSSISLTSSDEAKAPKVTSDSLAQSP